MIKLRNGFQTWHTTCFNCNECKKKVNDEDFKLHNYCIYCLECSHEVEKIEKGTLLLIVMFISSYYFLFNLLRVRSQLFQSRRQIDSRRIGQRAKQIPRIYEDGKL